MTAGQPAEVLELAALDSGTWAPLGPVLELAELRRASRGNLREWGAYVSFRGELLWAVVRQGSLIRADVIGSESWVAR